ncbi:Aste57867_12670 [Aphanomyces stellatus]|uniref:Aste57867_12670 protein n=1 Tax=Aphanomyces stellatus TaxID=120398 RepID=A0A485KW74_9STRA|nr:hypothetical protein As57867_012623 [Aphanomyces stellatus]VFT89520.1 Aste57867_12670 [Aphanomyces stellatus]
MTEIRQRRRLDLDPGDDDDDGEHDLGQNPRDEAEDFVWTWLPIAFIAFALLTIASMYMINLHDDTFHYFKMLSHGPRYTGGGHAHDYRLTKETLASFNGVERPEIYLAILGQVFDVTAGTKHYGPDGAYRYFVGVDRSRAFSSGIKTDGEDVTTLSQKELLSVHKWLSFFAAHKDYSRVGTVEGLYYDKIGHAKPIVATVRDRIREALAEAEKVAAVERCNMQWTAEAGATTVWCQDEAKYPRAHNDGACGCFTPDEIAAGALPQYKTCTDKRCVVV